MFLLTDKDIAVYHVRRVRCERFRRSPLFALCSSRMISCVYRPRAPARVINNSIKTFARRRVRVLKKRSSTTTNSIDSAPGVRVVFIPCRYLLLLFFFRF